MGLTQDQKNAFRRLLGNVEWQADDETIAFYLANPRIIAAMGRGQLLKAFRSETFPVEPPTQAVRNLQAEAVPRRLVAEGHVETTLTDFHVPVDYRLSEAEAHARANVFKASLGNAPHLQHLSLPEFEDWSTAHHAKRKCGGVVVRKLRILSVLAETTARQVNTLIDLYDFARVEPRTLLAFIAAHPEVYGGFGALVATRAMVSEKGKADTSLAPCLYYVKSERIMLGHVTRRFVFDEIDDGRVVKFSKFGLLVEEPPAS